jgi:3-oxoacyl-[acyl-carrier protein] reductase
MSERRVIVITGGSRGIGRATALKFAEESPKLVLVHYDPTEDAIIETLNMLKEKDVAAESYKVDVSSYAAVESLFSDILEKHGKVDVLINNAGITRDKLLVRMGEEDWDRLLQVNLKSVFNCSYFASKAMMKERSGCIVNLASVVGQIGNVGQCNYAASKAGIMGFTKSLARELAPRGIRVNAVAPGFIDTEMTQVLPQKVKEMFLASIPMGRMGRPEEVADVIVWLCSDKSSYLTGQVIHVNGGLYM